MDDDIMTPMIGKLREMVRTRNETVSMLSLDLGESEDHLHGVAVVGQ